MRRIHSLLNTGYRDVVDADLADYFGSIPHSELLSSVARRVSDRHILHLIKQWIVVPVEEDDGRHPNVHGIADLKGLVIGDGLAGIAPLHALKVVETGITVERLGICVHKGNTTLRKEISKVQSELRVGGRPRRHDEGVHNPRPDGEVDATAMLGRDCERQ